MQKRDRPAPLVGGNRAGIDMEHSVDNSPKHNAQAQRSLTQIYEAKPIKRQIAIEDHLQPHQFGVLKAAEESERTIIREFVSGLGGTP
jgi:hypothetical protein